MTLSELQYLGLNRRQSVFDGLGVTFTRYPALQDQAWHCHENATLFLLLQGNFRDESNHQAGQVLPLFTAVFHPAGAIHRGNSGPQGRMGMNLEPTPLWLEEHGLRSADLGDYRYINDPHRCRSLVQFALRGDELAGSMALEYFLQLEFLDQPERGEWLQRGYDLVVDTPDWTLKSLAHELAVHPVYLARAFRSRFGMSVTDHIRGSRLMHAMRLAQSRPKSLAHAAIEGGYADHAHFSRHFRETYGMTPSEFFATIAP